MTPLQQFAQENFSPEMRPIFEAYARRKVAQADHLSREMYVSLFENFLLDLAEAARTDFRNKPTLPRQPRHQ